MDEVDYILVDQEIPEGILDKVLCGLELEDNPDAPFLACRIKYPNTLVKIKFVRSEGCLVSIVYDEISKYDLCKKVRKRKNNKEKIKRSFQTYRYYRRPKTVIHEYKQIDAVKRDIEEFNYNVFLRGKRTYLRSHCHSWSGSYVSITDHYLSWKANSKRRHQWKCKD